MPGTGEGEDRHILFHNADDFEDLMSGMEDKIVYNIEDLEFLNGSIDLGVLALALEKGEQAKFKIFLIWFDLI